MQRSVILMPNWIGDFALALSVVMHKQRSSESHITLLAPPSLIPLCTLLCPFPVIPYKRKNRAEFRATLQTVRHEHFDVIYILPPSFSSAWFSLRTGIKKRRGLGSEWRSPLLTNTLPASLRDVSHHITYEYALVLETDYNPPTYWQGHPIDPCRKYSGAIVLCPGSKYGPAKRWPWFKQLVTQLPNASPIVLLGGAEESEEGARIESAAPGRVTNLIGKTSLAEAAAIIAAARIVIANDSGLMHLSGFIGTPVVGIFGSTTPVWTSPLGKKAACAKIHCDCSPCFKRTCRYGHYNCLTKLSPEFVLSSASKYLGAQEV